MNAGEKRVFVAVICGAVATCVIAAGVTHDGRSTPLTLADVLITAMVPVGLWIYLTARDRRRDTEIDDEHTP